MKKKSNSIGKAALTFIVLMGVVSLFSDMTHEGARSILGDYLSLAGASAAVISFVSGLGELVGYSLRLLTGILADKTKRYWTLTVVGYTVDVLAIPALALVPRGGWILACALVILERAAKAVKKPAKDTLLSFAAARTGVGKSFALQEFLDQLGAFLGPVILFLVLLVRKGGDTFSNYALCFAVLGIPAVVTIALLLTAKRKFPDPESFEPEPKDPAPPFHMNRAFLFYLAAIGFFAFGFLDFTLITLHTARSGLIASDALPLLYAGAMVVDAFSALFFGWLYDRRGVRVLMLSTLLSAPFAVFIFLLDARWALFLGVALWGVGMGAQESILKAAVTTLVPKQSRSTGFGVFQTSFGVCWFLGSWLMGALYDASPVRMVIFSVAMELAAVPLFGLAARRYGEGA
ncbi:MAG TPA: MFS transporter [Oscillospiraceae bacterium]|nr:MFS transporter [Oscillospiraceae bacterium]